MCGPLITTLQTLRALRVMFFIQAVTTWLCFFSLPRRLPRRYVSGFRPRFDCTHQHNLYRFFLLSLLQPLAAMGKHLAPSELGVCRSCPTGRCSIPSLGPWGPMRPGPGAGTGPEAWVHASGPGRGARAVYTVARIAGSTRFCM